ncbi:MAG: hypothetical protein MHPSP_004146 [Paramarteilia canceri]
MISKELQRIDGELAKKLYSKIKQRFISRRIVESDVLCSISGMDMTNNIFFKELSYTALSELIAKYKLESFESRDSGSDIDCEDEIDSSMLFAEKNAKKNRKTEPIDKLKKTLHRFNQLQQKLSDYFQFVQ